MSVTGRTNNKLFKIKRVDLNEPFKVGVNGVTNIGPIDDDLYIIDYTLDDIRYVTYSPVPFNELTKNTREDLSDPVSGGKLIKFKKITNGESQNSFVKVNKGVSQGLNFKPDLEKGNPEILYKRNKPVRTLNIAPQLGETTTKTDTLCITKGFSYENFVERKIYKKERYVGLIDKPIITSDVFMERDNEALFERQQRLSEINNLSDLIDYKNGYFNVTNTF